MSDTFMDEADYAKSLKTPNVACERRDLRDTKLWHFIHIVFPPWLNEEASRAIARADLLDGRVVGENKGDPRTSKPLFWTRVTYGIRVKLSCVKRLKHRKHEGWNLGFRRSVSEDVIHHGIRGGKSKRAGGVAARDSAGNAVQRTSKSQPGNRTVAVNVSRPCGGLDRGGIN